MQTNLRARIAKAVTVGAAVALSVSMSGLAAQAAAPEIGDINPSQNGSITIYKHVHQTSSPAVAAAVDAASDPIPSDPVKDVVFAAFPATGLNLTGDNANANWKKISEVTAEKLAGACANVTEAAGTPVLDGFTFGERQPFAPTDAKGKTTKANMPQGAYLLCEVKAPATVVGKAAPVLVTLPHPDEPTGKWHYDVNIFPKNSVTGIKKTILEQPLVDLGLEKTITWPVTADIPALGADEHLAYFIVKDPMTDQRIGSRGVASVMLGEEELIKNTDYKVTVSETKNKEHVSVGLTQAGLAKVEGAQGGKLIVNFTSTLKTLGDGKLTNDAQLLIGKWKKPNPENPPTNPDEPPSGDIPPYPTEPPTTPKVTSNWGNLKLHKVNAGDTKEGLKGAKFQVFAADDEHKYADDCTGATPQGEPLKVTAADTTEFVSNEQGLVEIPGLFVSDSVNAPINKEHRCYVVKEIQAPDGYVIPTNDTTPVKVTIGATAESQYDVTIENSKSTVPQLPLTGAAAQLLLPIIGGILVVGGLAAAYAHRRRKTQI